MRGALGVFIDDGDRPQVVTGRVKGLKFRKVANGGHHSMSCMVTAPLGAFTNLGPSDRISVSDSRTGTKIWDGYTENPGVTDGPAGQSFDLSAMGGMVLANDRSTPFVFIERSLDDSLWVRVDNITPGGTNTVETGAPGIIGDDSLILQFPSGIPVGTSRVTMQYQGLMRTGQRLLDMVFETQAGKSDAGYAQELVTRQDGDPATGEVPYTQQFNTSLVSGIAALAGTHFPLGRNTPELRIMRVGAATNVADDLTWARFQGIAIRPVLAKADGTDALTGYLPYNVRAYEVVNHLLGTALPLVDGPNATVDVTSASITQMTFHDGATPAQVLDSLPLYEPDFQWGIGAANSHGRHEFWYRAWPTTPRYEISVKDGFTAPGGDVDLCNRVIVYFTDAAGVKRSVMVGQVVPELGATNPVISGALDPSFTGRVRDAQAITLPEGRGSAADAAQIGQMTLASKATPPKAGTATVRRPIMDRLAGCTVMPWEIEPGYLVRVRETGDDLRLTEMEYVDQDCAATLTLGTPQLTPDQVLARLGITT